MNESELSAKPLTLLREEFVENLINLCNNSGLPFFVAESVIKELLPDIHSASQKQLESDREKYNNLMKLQLQSKDVEGGG